MVATNKIFLINCFKLEGRISDRSPNTYVVVSVRRTNEPNFISIGRTEEIPNAKTPQYQTPISLFCDIGQQNEAKYEICFNVMDVQGSSNDAHEHIGQAVIRLGEFANSRIVTKEIWSPENKKSGLGIINVQLEEQRFGNGNIGGMANSFGDEPMEVETEEHNIGNGNKNPVGNGNIGGMANSFGDEPMEVETEEHNIGNGNVGGNASGDYKIGFKAKNLVRIDLLGTNPMFKMYRKDMEIGKWVRVYQSEVKKGTRSPNWETFTMSAEKLCRNDPRCQMKLQIVHKSMSLKTMGECRFFLDELKENKNLVLMSIPANKRCTACKRGDIYVNVFEMPRRKSISRPPIQNNLQDYNNSPPQRYTQNTPSQQANQGQNFNKNPYYLPGSNQNCPKEQHMQPSFEGHNGPNNVAVPVRPSSIQNGPHEVNQGTSFVKPSFI